MPCFLEAFRDERNETTEDNMPERDYNKLGKREGPLARFLGATNETNSWVKDPDKKLELMHCVCTVWLI